MKKQILEKVDQVISKGSFKASWDSLENYKIPRWYEDAKFGIFVHWGLYSVPAFGNEWYPRNMYIKGSAEFEHHAATYGPHSKFGYKDFIPMFTAENFNPDAWAELFKKSGARFVVPVAEHHDGFQLYDSVLSKWNSVQMGPMRDIIGELSKAVREHGIVFGASSHRAEHWWYFGDGRYFDSDVRNAGYEDFYGPAKPAPGKDHFWDNYKASSPDSKYLDDWLARTCELIDRYQPQILWFDWWIMNLAFKPYLKKLAAYYYNSAESWGKGVAINHKYDAFPVGMAVFDVERGQLSGTRSIFWQTDTSISKNSWGYVQNQDYKTAEEIVCDLADIVSKNGALLLNIGPRADGTIPEEEQKILLNIGKWLAVNGEAIYATRPWNVYGEGPTKVSEGAFTDTSRSMYTSEDIRFTCKGDALYAIVLKWPENGVVNIKSLAEDSGIDPTRIVKVELLDGNVQLEWNHNEKGLFVQLAKSGKSDFAVVIKITSKELIVVS